jgi:hypothetical protein
VFLRAGGPQVDCGSDVRVGTGGAPLHFLIRMAGGPKVDCGSDVRVPHPSGLRVRVLHFSETLKPRDRRDVFHLLNFPAIFRVE